MDVRLPNGRIIRNVPEGTTKDEIRATAIRNGLASAADFGETSSAAAQIPTDVGPPALPEEQMAKPVPWWEYALQGAAAVPPMAAAARGIQLAARGTKIAPYASSIAEVLIPKTGKQLAYEAGLGAASGVAGGLVGEQLPEGWQRDIGSAAAGAAVAAPVVMAKNVGTVLGSGGLGREGLKIAGQTSQALGEARASAQAATAIRANPNLVPTILRASEIEQRTGISLPMLAAANGDTTISSFLQSQLAKGENAEFAATMKSQYEAAEQALTKAKRGVAPSMEEVDAYVKRKSAQAAIENNKAAARATELSEKRQKGLDNIDARILELSNISAPGRTDTGTALTNLIKAKEAQIRGELSPQYEEIIKKGMDSGIVLPGESARNLRNFASDEMNDDVFAKFPSLYNMIKKQFRTVPTTEGTKAASKYRFAKEAPVTKDIPLNTLDSLKREVNKAIRDTTDKDQLRKLSLLKQEVDKAIDTVDPAFSGPYRAVDKEYATRLGIPFSEQGIVNIDRAKFVEQTVPAMTKEASSLKQTLAIIGDNPEGLKIVEDAFMYDISQNRSIINTASGKLDPNQLRRYLSQNKDKIDLVPGLRDKLEGLAGRVDVLNTNRAAILKAEKEASQEKVENLWTKAYGTSEGIQGLVRNAMSNPQKLDELIQLTTKDKVAQAGVKTAMLENILNAPGDRVDLFIQNRSTLEKVFGKKETENLGLIVEASQRLKDNPFVLRMNIGTISKTEYEKITGSKIDQTLGEARNQILSLPRVFINHLSRYFQKTATQSEAAEVQKFLLDPKNLENTAKLMVELDTKGFSKTAKNIIGDIMKNSASGYLFGAMSGAIAAQRAPEEKRYEPTDASLLEGFGQ